MKNSEQFTPTEEQIEKWQQSKQRGRIAFGLVLVAAATLLVLKELGMLQATWLLSWPMILIAIGFVSLIKRGWRHPGWIFMMGLGGVFLTGMLYPDLAVRKFIFPAVLALAGLMFIFRPKNNCRGSHGYYRNRQRRKYYGAFQEISSTENEVHINNSFSGVKRSIISKDFKGGEIRNNFGGCELNLMHAEIQTEASINIDQQFGGLKIIVPSHWRIRSEVNCVLGTVEDQRSVMTGAGADNKTLVLKGNVLMGGVEIVSY